MFNPVSDSLRYLPIVLKLFGNESSVSQSGKTYTNLVPHKRPFLFDLRAMFLLLFPWNLIECYLSDGELTVQLQAYNSDSQ